MDNPNYFKGTDGSDVLINLLGYTTAAKLKKFEDKTTLRRMAKLEVKPIQGKLDYQHP